MIETFVNAQASEKTKRAYAYDLKKWFEYLGDATPTVDVAVNFRSYLESNLASSSAARIFNTCRTYYRWLQVENPFEYIRSTKTTKNRTPRVPSDSEVASIINSAGPELNAQLIIALCLNGLRSEEVIRVRREDVIWENKYQTFVIRVLGKGDKERLVPANSYLSEALVRYQYDDLAGKTWLLERSDGSQWTTRQVQYTIERHSNWKLRPHSLRHHYATRLIRNGVNVFAVQRLLGHESVETTQVYVTLDLSDLIFEAKKDPLYA